MHLNFLGEAAKKMKKSGAYPGIFIGLASSE